MAKDKFTHQVIKATPEELNVLRNVAHLLGFKSPSSWLVKLVTDLADGKLKVTEKRLGGGVGRKKSA